MDDKEILRNKIRDALILKPLPDDLLISTITLCCALHIEFKVNNIAKYIDLKNSSIVKISYGRADDPATNRALVPKKKHKKKKKTKRVFYNQVSLSIMIDSKREKPINIKLFTNGSIQMTGCKSIENVIDVLEKIFVELKIVKGIVNLKTMKIDDVPFVNDVDKLKLSDIHNITIGMINSNFDYPNQIDRLKLYNLLLSDTIECKFDPSNHACVNIKYYSDSKKISILVFEEGAIVITGAQNYDHILEAYNFINRYLLQNHRAIVKSNISINDIMGNMNKIDKFENKETKSKISNKISYI
jgi:TATA-box binding protein (TBP) (component of TFIID and TFIIIB)